MSDAKLSHQDLYIKNVDFSAAFNTTDHDKLLYIMQDLGFPPDTIHLIADLYTDAMSQIQLYFTDPMATEKGNNARDTLSWLLFLISSKPPLRWLHSRDRGYKPRCLSNPEHAGYSNNNND